LIAVHDCCPREDFEATHSCEAVASAAAVLAVRGCCSELGPEVLFCTHTNAPTPTLTSAHTNTHVGR